MSPAGPPSACRSSTPRGREGPPPAGSRDEVVTEIAVLAIDDDFVVSCGELGDLGVICSGSPHFIDRPSRAQLDVDREVLLDLRIAYPESVGRAVGASFLQRINVAADAAVDRQRLVIDEADLGLALRAN